MDRGQKEKLIASLAEVFGSVNLVVVTKPTGLTVAESTDLRRRMREAGASFKVTKNRLTRLALKGTRFESLTELFVGETAIAYSSDPVAAARVAVKFATDNQKLVVLGGALFQQKLDAEGIKNLATLPSLDELRGRLVGMLQTPATRIAGVLQAPAGFLVDRIAPGMALVLALAVGATGFALAGVLPFWWALVAGWAIVGIAEPLYHPADYAIIADACSGRNIAPNGTCSVSASFTPSTAASESAQLNFADNASGSPQIVALSGTGVQSSVMVSPRWWRLWPFLSPIVKLLFAAAGAVSSRESTAWQA